MRLRVHALAVAAEFAVQVRECAGLDPDLPGRGPFAHVEARVVDVLPVTDVRSYLIVLHEVGHIADPAEGLVGEGRAWRFVLNRSLVPVDRKLVLSWWGSHVAAAGGDLWTGGWSG